MNKLTAFDEPREAKRKPRKVFYSQENSTKTEGETLSCPFCGQELAHTKKSLLDEGLLMVTSYVHHPSGLWIKPEKGAQMRMNYRQRERRNRAILRERGQATPAEKAVEAKALKQFGEASNRQIVTNARTGETKSLNEKGGSMPTEVRGDGVFQCRQCNGRVKIKVSK